MTENSDHVPDMASDRGGDVEALRADLTDDDLETQRQALQQCVQLADESPEAVVDLLDTLVDLLDDDMLVVTQRSAEAISGVAVANPEAASVAAGPLVDTLEGSDSTTQFYVGSAVRPIAADDPTVFVDELGEILAFLAEDAAEPEDFSHLDGENGGLRQSLDYMSKSESQSQYAARGILVNVVVAIAEERPDAVTPYVNELVEVLGTNVELVVSATLDAIATVAEQESDAADDTVDDVVGLLDHDDAGIRAGAVKALGFIGASDTRDVLRGVAKTDRDEDVRELAKETVEFVD